jgi:trk system potassium uptake protein TrkH
MAHRIQGIVNPYKYLVNTFLILIISGAILLYCPFAYSNGHLHLIDAIFMSTSAVCVTGLTTVNVSDFNLVGQIIILLLIQLGGLGIMYLSSVLFLFLKGQLSFSQRLMFSKFHGTYEYYNMERILPIILLYTFCLEFIGAFCLTLGFFFQGYDVLTSIYFGIFHSISAFCNAGLSPINSSIVGLNYIIKITIMFLIVCGGLGFYVVYDIYMHFKVKTSFRVHTKVVLLTTFVLIMIGVLGLLVFEKGNIALIDSFFQSITARTAGFNTVDLAKLSIASKFLIIFLMIIGASPASTGGGIKTTTAFVAFFSTYIVLRGKLSFVIFKRRIPAETIMRSFSLTLLYLFVVFLGTIIILLTQELTLINSSFEVASALGTVGLSLGATRELSEMGKVIIIIWMFLGRVGPSALLLMIINKEKMDKIIYPEEKVLLG